MSRSLLLFLLMLCTAPGAAALELFVSILPQQFLAEQVGGREVQVHVLVGPGQNPATYEPTSRQLALLERARLYWRIGVPFETRWLPRLKRLNPHLRILDAREDVPLLGAHRHGAEIHADPHIWMDPNRTIIMVRRLAEALARLDPEHAKGYRTRAERLVSRLEALDGHIRTRLACLETRTFMAFHPAWSYFAEAYGLKQLVIEQEGKRPGARGLTRLIEQARRDGVRLILAQIQFSDADTRALASATGAALVHLDPLSADYFGMMERLVETLREHLGCRNPSSASKT